MPPQRDDLRHDLTALYAFIESIVGWLASRRSSAAYGPAAEEFFQFVGELAESCESHIADFSVADDEEFEDRREELGTIRAAWRLLHLFIKPAIDADTLQAPWAVVDGLIRRYRILPGCGDTRFALFHTAEFNYVQIRTADLQNIAAKIRKIIPIAPKFPIDLGLIGIPYSQGGTVFANCLVAHEIGHYRYRGTDLENSLKPKIEDAYRSLPDNFRVALEDDFKNASTNKDKVIKRLAVWAEEIFCDMFGLMLIGPCYAYAYIEAFDLSAVLDSNGQISNERFLPRLQFHETYPSHIFRLQQQSLLLRESPWWGDINGNSCRSAALLRALQSISTDSHISENQSQGKYIPLLESVLPAIKEAIGKIFDGVDDGFAEFSHLDPAVQNCLAAGVVPSTLNIRTGERPEDTMAFAASPIVLLNSGMNFYLTHINELIGSISGEDVDSYPMRLHWLRRIEEWTAKALEDQSIGMEDKGDNSIERENPTAPQA